MRASRKATLRYGSPRLNPDEREIVTVGLAGAVSSKDTKFSNLHDKCQSRMSEVRRCTTCEVDVPPENILKGWEYQKGEFLVFTQDEIDDCHPDRSSFIDVQKFIPRGELGQLMIEKNYFLIPDEVTGGRYGVLYHALLVTKAVGLGSENLFATGAKGKEHPIAIFPEQGFLSGGVLMMAVLHPHEDLTQPDFSTPTPSRAGIQVGRTKVEEMMGHLEPEDLEIGSRTKIQELLSSRMDNGKPEPPELLDELKATVKAKKPVTKTKS